MHHCVYLLPGLLLSLCCCAWCCQHRYSSSFKSLLLGAHKVVQRVKAPATEPDDLNSNPEPRGLKGENSLPRMIIWLPHSHYGPRTQHTKKLFFKRPLQLQLIIWGWGSRKEHLLLFHRATVQISAYIVQYIVICYFSSRESNGLFWPPWTLAHMCACMCTYIHTYIYIKIKQQKQYHYLPDIKTNLD